MKKDEHKHHDKETEKAIKENVKKYGWYIAQFFATDYLPSFAYTIGLWKNYGHPEIISFGFTIETLGAILNIAGEKIKSGEAIRTSHAYQHFFNSAKIQFIPVQIEYLPDYFGYGIWYNKDKPFPALQLVWSDRYDRFPWEADFEKEFIYRQPLLDRNVDFKFREPRNLAVATTRQWADLNKPILCVAYEEDGDWQFLTGDQEPKDIRMVAFEQLVLRDKSLNALFDLGYGEEANRSAVGGKWTRSKIVNEY